MQRYAEVGTDQLRLSPWWRGAVPKPDDALLTRLRAAGLEAVDPLRVRELPGVSTQYEILTGVRIWRAAGLLGLHTLPVLVCTFDDTLAHAWVQRDYGTSAAPNPIEIAERIKELVKEEGKSVASAGRALGLGRANASNHLRLLRLCTPVRAQVAAGELSVGHAKVLVTLTAYDQVEGARLACGRDALTAHALMLWAKGRREHHPAATTSKAEKEAPVWARQYGERLSTLFCTPVSIESAGQGGQIVLRYTSQETLEGILDQFKKLGFQVY